MATIYQSYAAPVTLLSTELNALSDATAGSNTVTSAAIDNTTGYLGIDIEITCAWANASATGTLDVYMMKSNDNSVFSTTETGNLLFLGSVSANGSTPVTKVIRAEQLPEYFKIYVVNSDATYDLAATSNTVKYALTALTN